MADDNSWGKDDPIVKNDWGMSDPIVGQELSLWQKHKNLVKASSTPAAVVPTEPVSAPTAPVPDQSYMQWLDNTALAKTDSAQAVKSGVGQLYAQMGIAGAAPMPFVKSIATSIGDTVLTGPLRGLSALNKWAGGSGELPLGAEKGAQAMHEWFHPAYEKYGAEMAQQLKKADDQGTASSTMRKVGAMMQTDAADAHSAEYNALSQEYGKTKGFEALDFLVKHPGRLFDMTLENLPSQAPMLALGYAGGAVARSITGMAGAAAGEVALKEAMVSPAFLMAKTMGTAAEKAAAIEVAKTTAMQAAANAAAAAMVKWEPVLTALSIGSESSTTVFQTADAIHKAVESADPANLAKLPMYQEYLKQSNGDDKAARALLQGRLSAEYATLAGQGTAAGSILTGGGAATAAAMAGQVNLYKEAAKNTGKEILEEAVQNPLEDIGQHGAIVQVDPSATSDPIKSSIEGAAVSLGQAGATQFAVPIKNSIASGFQSSKAKVKTDIAAMAGLTPPPPPGAPPLATRVLPTAPPGAPPATTTRPTIIDPINGQDVLGTDPRYDMVRAAKGLAPLAEGEAPGAQETVKADIAAILVPPAQVAPTAQLALPAPVAALGLTAPIALPSGTRSAPVSPPVSQTGGAFTPSDVIAQAAVAENQYQARKSQETPLAQAPKAVEVQPSQPLQSPAPAAAPRAGAVAASAEQGSELDAPVEEIAVAGLKLSGDIPQFKEGADARGIITPLYGRYDRALASPIQVWRRNNGDMEVISGRHRLDLAQRDGQTTIPAQVHNESDGFNTAQARVLDIELNVKDGRGKVKDYVNYFREVKSHLTPSEAQEDGLLNTAVGRAAFGISNNGGESLIAAHANDAITDDAAVQIAQNAPQNEALQNLGIKYVNDGKSINFSVNAMRAAQAAGFKGGDNGDLFGFDDAFAKEAEAVAKEANRQQVSARQKLAAIQGAAKRPGLAKEGGVMVKNQRATEAKIAQLKQQIIDLEGFATNPEVYKQLRIDAGLAPQGDVAPVAPVVAAPAATAEAPAAPAAAVVTAPKDGDINTSGVQDIRQYQPTNSDQDKIREALKIYDRIGDTDGYVASTIAWNFARIKMAGEKTKTFDAEAILQDARDKESGKVQFVKGGAKAADAAAPEVPVKAAPVTAAPAAKKLPATEIRIGDAVRVEGGDYIVTGGITGGIVAAREVPNAFGVTEIESKFLLGDDAIRARLEAVKAATPAPVPEAPAAPAAGVERGTIGMMLSSGQVVTTQTGRETTPFPNVRKSNATTKAGDQWLMQNAIDEAVSRGDKFNERQFKADLNNPQQAGKDAAEEYLFGDYIPKVVPSILKPLVAAVPVDAKAKWLKALNDQNRLAGDTGVQLKVQNGKLTFFGDTQATIQGRRIAATLAQAQKAGATVDEIIAAINAPAAPATPAQQAAPPPEPAQQAAPSPAAAAVLPPSPALQTRIDAVVQRYVETNHEDMAKVIQSALRTRTPTEENVAFWESSLKANLAKWDVKTNIENGTGKPIAPELRTTADLFTNPHELLVSKSVPQAMIDATLAKANGYVMEAARLGIKLDEVNNNYPLALQNLKAAEHSLRGIFARYANKLNAVKLEHKTANPEALAEAERELKHELALPVTSSSQQAPEQGAAPAAAPAAVPAAWTGPSQATRTQVVQPWQMTQEQFVAKNKDVNAAWQVSHEGPSHFGNFYGHDYQAYMDDKSGELGTYEAQMHKSEVRNALANGQEVPAEVLAQYPDLKPQPAAAAPAKHFRNPDGLNVLRAPIEDGDWFKLKNGDEWQARQGYSGRGWSLVRNGQLHPEARNYESQADFMRSVIEVTSQTQAPGQVKGEIQPWQTVIPPRGMPVAPSDTQADGPRNVIYRLAQNAVGALTQNQRMGGQEFYPYALPATETEHGIVRFFPYDQKPPAPWKLVSGESVRPSMTAPDVITARLQKQLGSSPVLAYGKSMTGNVYTADGQIFKPSENRLVGSVAKVGDKEVHKPAVLGEYPVFVERSGKYKTFTHKKKITAMPGADSAAVSAAPVAPQSELTAPTRAEVLQQQDNAANASALDEQARLQRESEAQALAPPVAPEQRTDTSGDMFAVEKAQAEIAKRNAGKVQEVDPNQVKLFDEPAADPVAQAKAHLDAAGITGTERTNTIAQVRRGDLTPAEVAEAHGVPADGKSRAVTGGQIGVNGYEYKGGQFLPSTELPPGSYRGDDGKVHVGNRGELIEPGKFENPPSPTSRSILVLAGAGTATIFENGKLVLNPGANGDGTRWSDGTQVTPDSVITPGIKGVLFDSTYTLQELMDLYARGARWLELKPAQPAGKIEDVGEKIGGARKDTAVSTGPKAARTTVDDGKPTWAKRFQIGQVVGGFDIQNYDPVTGKRESLAGKWVISDLRNKDRMGQPRQVGHYFDTKAKAEAALPLLAVAQKHRVVATRVQGYKAPSAAEVDAQLKADMAAKAADDNAPGKFEYAMMQNAKKRLQVGTITQADYDRVTAQWAEKAAQYTPPPSAADKADATMVYEIWRDISDHKRVKVVDQTFATRNDAMQYMAQHATEILETSTTFGEADLPQSESTLRTGVPRRTGDVQGQHFKDTFGFRGVEFGNWNNQTERQEVMNAAFDGLHDLADVLGIPPKAIGLNGDLALAFGARGQGLSSARAHYEREHAVMNLTKMNGAGALAHEWFHALDHYLGRQDGKATSTWTVNPDGTRTFKVSTSPSGDYVSHGFAYKSGVRAELKAAYTTLVESLFTKAEQYVEDTARADKFVGRAKDELATALAKIRAGLAEQKDVRYYKRNNKPASAEQLAEFDAVAAELVEGRGLPTAWTYTSPGDTPANKAQAMAGRHSNEALEKLSAINKAVRGRSGFDSTNKNGVFDNLRSNMDRYEQRLKMLSDANKSTEKTKQVPTSFAMDAKSLDQGRGADYWTTPHEMVARAFQGYVEDRVAAKGGKSPFLNYAPENSAILTPWGLKRPYPAGAERKAMNAAFDAFVRAIKVRETDQGTAMYSRTWRSALADGIDALTVKAAPADGWLATIKGMVNKGTVKAAEVEWSGVTDWIKMQGGKVSKEDVAAFLKGNGVKVTETVLGAPLSEDPEGIAARKAVFDRYEPEIGRIYKDMDQSADTETQMKQLADLMDKRDAEADAAYTIPENDPSKFDQYQLPGGENYREVLLTLPPKDSVKTKTVQSPRGWGDTDGVNLGVQRTGDTGADYRSGHWNQPNVLAHIRVNDRVDADGKKVLFVEEIQSDWGQAGKKKGFVTPGKLPDGWTVVEQPTYRYRGGPQDGTEWMVYDKTKTQTGLGSSTREGAIASATTPGPLSGVPDAPFVTKTDAWVALALKRVIKMAVDGGYDRVAFVNGQQSADRYDLSKQISAFNYEPIGDTGTYEIEALDHAGRAVIEEDDVPLSRIEELVGKEIAKKVEAREGKVFGQSYRDWHRLSGLDLKVGGEGMKAFYDQIVPAAVKDVLRKLGGGQMETMDMKVPRTGLSDRFEWVGPDLSADDVARVAADNSHPAQIQQHLREIAEAMRSGMGQAEAINDFASIRAAEALGGTMQPGAPATTQQISFAITPAMKEQASKGMPLFSEGTNATPTTVPALEQAITEFTGKFLGNQLGRIVATTADQIKSTWEPLVGRVNLESEGDAVKAQAFYDRTTKTVFLIADHIEAGTEQAVLAHELMHKHGQAVLGEAGWNKLHGTIQTWKQAQEGTQERAVYDYASQRVNAAGAGLSSQELFPYAVEGALKLGIKPSLMAAPGTVARWLETVKQALHQVWSKITGKPETFKAQDLVDLAFGIAQRENNPGLAIADQTETPAFKKWYGDWHNAVGGAANERGRANDVNGIQRQGGVGTNAHGPVTVGDITFTGTTGPIGRDAKPVIFYHGTRDDFAVVRRDHPNRKDKGWLGDGVYVVSSADMADDYAWAKHGQSGRSIMPLFMAVGNPYIATQAVKDKYSKASASEITKFTENLKAQGHDGVAMVHVNGVVELVAFSNTDVKSAIGNNGNFDGTNPDIQYSRKQFGQFGDLTPDQLEAVKNVIGVPKTLKERAAQFGQDWRTETAQGVFDQFSPILAYSTKGYMQARMSKGSSSTLEAIFMYGKPYIDENGDINGQFDHANGGQNGFASVLAKLDGEHDRFLLWVAATRAERLKTIGLENLFSDTDIARLKTTNQGQLQNGKDRAAAYNTALRGLMDYNNAMLDIAWQRGLISAETRRMFQDMPYVPFYRLMEEGIVQGFVAKGGLVNQQAWKRLSGGTEKLHADLLANVLKNWSHLIEASARNESAKTTLNEAVRLGAAQEVPSGTPGKGLVHFRENTTTELKLDPATGLYARVEKYVPAGQTYKDANGVSQVSNGTAQVMENVERTFSVSDPYLLDAITSIDNTYRAPKVMRDFKQLLTSAVTVNPAFKLRNLIRDSIQATLLDELSYNPVKNAAKGLALTKIDSETRAKLLFSGGMIRFGSMLDGNNADMARELVTRGVPEAHILDNANKVEAMWSHHIKPAFDAYQELGDRSEQVNRAALYEILTRPVADGGKGMTHGEASFWARDLMDFSMSGKWQAVRFLTQTVPFLNAGLQGAYKLGKSTAKNKARAGIVMGAVVMASLALLGAGHDDPEWKKREDWDRDNYWWFKVGGYAFRVPKPFEVGAIGTLAERLAELAFDDEMTGERFKERLISLVTQQLRLNPVPQLVKPLLELYANKNFFTDRPIETQGMEKLLPEDRSSENTSGTAKLLGSLGLPNPVSPGNTLSPVQVDSLIRGYFSWVGTSITTALDYGIFHPLENKGAAVPMKLKDVFLAGNFVESLPAGSSRYVTQLYEQAAEIEQAYGSYRKKLMAGDQAGADALMKKEGNKINQVLLVRKLIERESMLSKQIIEVRNDKKMSGPQKRVEIDGLTKQKDELAQMLKPG